MGDENRIVRRLGLTAAGLLAMLTLALTIVNTGTARPSLAHTCTATDRQFIQEGRDTMAEIGLWSDQYASGDAGASDVVGQAIPGLERPPAAQIAVRAVVLTAFVLLGAALWEETKDRPAEAIKGIIELVALWYALTCGSGAGCPRLPDRRRMLVVLGFPSRFATVLTFRRRKPRQRVQAGS